MLETENIAADAGIEAGFLRRLVKVNDVWLGGWRPQFAGAEHSIPTGLRGGEAGKKQHGARGYK
jgi:hypothetical protein